jgi:hypothetical protein
MTICFKLRFLAQPQPTHCLDPTVKGLPPKSPVYAVINKVNKKKGQQQQPQSPQHCQQQQQQMYNSQQQQPLIFQVNQQPQMNQIFQINQHQQQQHQQQQLQQSNGGVQYHNYCNVAPLLGDVLKQGENEYAQMTLLQTDLKNAEAGCDVGSDAGCENGGHYYENTAAVLARLKDSEASTSNANGSTQLNVAQMTSSNVAQLTSTNVGGMGDYISMDPKMFSQTEMPLIPFEPLTYKFKGGEILPPPKYESIDPIRCELFVFF